jgi:hypothetical protein
MSENILVRRQNFFAIALLSCAVLLFEIATTRILSVVLWYHWAFLCTSMAMLGLGAPGVWLSMMRHPGRLLSHLTLLAAALVPLSVILICKLGYLFRASGVVFCMGAMLLPMLCLGAAICLLLMEARGTTIGRMYAFDLVGACLGALLVIPLLHLIPTPELVGAIGFLPLIAHILIKGRITKAAVGLALLLIGAIAWHTPFSLGYTKVYQEVAQLKPIYEKWTPTARLTVFDNIFWVGRKDVGFGWGRGTKAVLAPAEQYWIEQDGSAGTPLTRFNGQIASYKYLFDDVTTIGYQVRSPSTVAIVGAGGGRDILTALYSGAKRVDAVELNSHLVSLVSNRFKEFSGDVYHLPGVNAVVSEGRSFLTRSPQSYDMIQISLIDSWAATSAGAYALSENNLYTLQALQLYYRRLADHGMLSMSRWVLGVFWIEVPRLVLLVKETLMREGITYPNDHIAVVRGGGVGTVLVSKTPFSRAEVATLGQLCQQRGFSLLFPQTPTSGPNSLVADMLLKGPSSIREKSIRLDPPTDDKPFFFQMLSPFHLVDKKLNARYGINAAEAVYALQLLMICTAATTLVLFFLPFILQRWFKRYPGYWRGSCYFCTIGIAFMLVEIPWMQRFILYLGHPSYATTTVLGVLLFGAAIGSMTSTRLGLARVQKLGVILPLVLFCINLILTPFFNATLGLPLGLRVLGTVLVLTPVAFLMGLWFPLGMVRFGDGNKAWFWAMNGAAGVLASVISLALSMEFGFTAVAVMGAGFYILAWLLLGGREAAVVS